MSEGADNQLGACAEEWTYRFLAAAHAWAVTERAALQRISSTSVDTITEIDRAPVATEGPL